MALFLSLTFEILTVVLELLLLRLTAYTLVDGGSSLSVTLVLPM
jgi:hypothetical protein